MIKELNYYLTTNRFSEIVEEFNTLIRDYSGSFGNNKTGDAALRDKVSSFCEEQLVKSGIRSKENSFINVDTEFFDNGQLVEASCNRFIKSIVKSHGYQRILWEYMGTTGLMTSISKDKMKSDGFNYENYLPASIKEKEIKKKKNTITRDFVKLKDDFGFDWSKGYNPNDTVKKQGWKADFDADEVWSFYKTDESGAAKQSAQNVVSIKLIKTERGCMLYDSGDLLFNPVILFYLTQDDEVYGGKKSDTAKLIDDIKNQMEKLNVKTITEVYTSNKNISAQDFKTVLGKIADEKLEKIDSASADNILKQNQQNEKIELIKRESTELQNKVNVLLKAKPGISSAEIALALENNSVKISVASSKKEDAAEVNLTEQEFDQIKGFADNLPEQSRKSFYDVCAKMSANWALYKNCGISKAECIEHLYEYIKDEKEYDFSYEISLKEIIEKAVLAGESTNAALEESVKQFMPAENQNDAITYIKTIPEQKAEVKAKVYGSLYNAVKNYQTIRMSTGMSIKELFDYAIKNAHGTLPKASYVPPTFGYVTPNSKAAGGASGVDPTGNKRIYFENKISSLYENLLNEELPQKTVNFEQLEKEFSNALKEKPVVKIKIDSAKDFEMIYPSVDAEFEKLYGPAYFEFLKEYFYSIENKAERSFDDDSGIFARSAVIKPVFRQVEVLEKSSASFAKNATSDFSGELAAVNDEITAQQKLGSSKSAAAGGKAAAMSDIFSRTVVLPENLHTVKAKKRASGLLEDTFVVQFRENNAASKNQNAESAVQNNNSGALSDSDQEAPVTVLLKNMKNDERVELLGVVNNDESLLTPLLIKEYLWRKQNKKSVSGLLNDVSDVEKVQKFNSSQLEGLYKLLGVKNNGLKNAAGGASAAESSFEGASQNVLSGEVSKTSLGGGIADFAGKGFATKGFAAGESGDFGNLGQNYAQSAETAAAIALASGSESVASLVAQDTPVMISTKAKHLSAEKSEVLKNQYDMNLSWFSPVLMSYIANKEWITGSANSSAGGANGFEESLFANTNASSDAASAGVTPKAQNMTVQKIAVNPAKKFELEEKAVAANKREYKKPVVKKNLSPEEQRMARINANYEKDRAALAKTDPAFMAKNQFFDVGHAEGSEDELDRNVLKSITKGLINGEMNKVNNS